MNRNEAIDFARASALAAIDQAGAFEDAVSVYRENVIDTHSDECDHADAYLLADMLATFDAALAGRDDTAFYLMSAVAGE